MKELYKKYRKLLFTLAYQLTGSVEDAEDAVQDVFIKYFSLNSEAIEEPKAYLCKMVTNRCLDHLKSARKRREQYFGPWLPEPIGTATDDSVESVIRSDLLSYGMLVLLERLSAAERAVFVLREALRFEYVEIARLVDKSEANCRKLASRARGKMGFSDTAPMMAESAGEDWVRRFVAAIEQDKVDTVLSLLAEDVVLVSDGGGKITAAVRPIETRERVAKFLLGLFQKMPSFGGDGSTRIELSSLNGQIGVIVRTDDTIITAVLMHVERNEAKTIYFMRNPDKLTRL